ncbi:MAG: hypothetical protein HYT22_01765 [Candidatus Niyogibacteria bacterium]|nr:hypothetical protein [Candidatus Niyogibacteria bacterium]
MWKRNWVLYGWIPLLFVVVAAALWLTKTPAIQPREVVAAQEIPVLSGQTFQILNEKGETIILALRFRFPDGLPCVLSYSHAGLSCNWPQAK